MKNLFLVIGAVFSFDHAMAASAKPVECLVTFKAAVATKTCLDFDEKVAGTKESVCIFKDGSWRRGRLKIAKGGKNSEFTSVFICDQGINVIRNANSIEYSSPSLGDYYAGKKSIVDVVSKKYHSKLTSSPAKSTESPIVCYLENSNGLSYAPRACAPYPNKSSYCEFGTSPNGNFTGKWWVLYQGENKRNPALCMGGVQLSDAKKALNEFGEEQNVVKVTALKESNIKTVFSTPDLKGKNSSDANVVSCTTVDAKNRPTRHICSNQNSSGYESWVSKKNAYNDLVFISVTSGKGEKILALRRSISNGNKAAREKAQDELDTLLEKIDSAVDAKMNKLTEYPVEVTKAEEGACYINWNPANNLGHKYDFVDGTPAAAKSGSTVYMFKNVKVNGEWVLQKNACSAAEASEKIEIEVQ